MRDIRRFLAVVAFGCSMRPFLCHIQIFYSFLYNKATGIFGKPPIPGRCFLIYIFRLYIRLTVWKDFLLA